MDANCKQIPESFIEIRGREGSTAVYRKKVSHIDNVTDAEIQKLLGIARRLPAIAFDALFDPATIEIELNPGGKLLESVLKIR
jgi:hypothetical protein